MKFAFILFKYFPHGGLERDFIRISDACQQQGHEIYVYTMHWQGTKPRNLNIIETPTKGFTNHRRCANFVKKLHKILDPTAYDAIVGFNRMPGLDLYYAADICYKHNAYANHGFLYRLTSRYKTYIAFERAVFAPSAKTHIMYLAPTAKQLYQKYYHTPEERFHLLSPGIAKDRLAPKNYAEIRQQIRQQYKINNQQQLILLIGSDFKRKGVDRALLALASLPETTRKNTLLWIIGKGKISKYEKKARKLNLSQNVRFLGTTNKIPELLLAANLLLHPARREAAGLVLIEALAANLPVLVTDVCGFAFHIKHAQAGLIIPSPFQQQTLNNYLYKMLTSKQHSTWRKNAKKYAQQEWLYDRNDAVRVIEDLGLRTED